MPFIGEDAGTKPQSFETVEEAYAFIRQHSEASEAERSGKLKRFAGHHDEWKQREG